MAVANDDRPGDAAASRGRSGGGPTAIPPGSRRAGARLSQPRAGWDEQLGMWRASAVIPAGRDRDGRCGAKAVFGKSERADGRRRSLRKPQTAGAAERQKHLMASPAPARTYGTT